MADDPPIDTATIRAAAVAIAATLAKALSDHDARSIMLTRDEALLAQGLIEGIVEELDRNGSGHG